MPWAIWKGLPRVLRPYLKTTDLAKNKNDFSLPLYFLDGKFYSILRLKS